MKKVLIINGPNLNLLGVREPGIYGTDSLESINEGLKAACAELDFDPAFFQSNHEGAIIDLLHESMGKIDGIVMNPGAFTHYSYAIRDAIAAVRIPVVEVHLSDPKTREPFRHVDVLDGVVAGYIAGLGKQSYFEGLKVLADLLGRGGNHV